MAGGDPRRQVGQTLPAINALVHLSHIDRRWSVSINKRRNTVLDLYSKMLIGWSMSERMTSTLVIDALQTALWNRKMPKGVIVHSDRGSQYCSTDYQMLLTQSDLVCSMSKRGDCYDNAPMESSNHSFKIEAIHGERLKTREDAKKQVFDYIEVYYNRNRLHSTLGSLTPIRFEELNVA